MDRPLPKNKGTYILPNLFTTASLFAGFLGLIYTTQGQYESCAIAILFSALMDGLDGKVARLTNTASEFGVQYDSLADLVAFGVAPAFLMYQSALHSHGKIGIAVSFLFTACAALRLARFNVSTTIANKRFFTGLPTPAAGCGLALLMLFVPFLPDFFVRHFSILALFFTAVLAILMVSNIRYASFKELGMFKAHPFRTIVGVIILFYFLIISNPRFYAFLVLTGYLMSGLVYTYILLPRKTRLAHPPSPSYKESHK